MKDRRNVLHRGRAMLTGALLACLLVGAPAAHAVFTSSTSTSMTASTYTLAAPTVSGLSATCDQVGKSGKYQLIISLTGHGTVPHANRYVLRMVSPAGIVDDKDVPTAGKPYDSGRANDNGVERGVWKYSIEAQYRVPGTTNGWTSAAVPRTITCE